MFNFLVSGEPVAAAETLAASADGRAFSGGSRVNDLIFLATALGTTHKTTSNCGHLFVAHSILRCQEEVINGQLQFMAKKEDFWVVAILCFKRR